MLCCAVKCHFEFDDLSHLRVAIRITEDTEGEAKHRVRLCQFHLFSHLTGSETVVIRTLHLILLTHASYLQRDL